MPEPNVPYKDIPHRAYLRKHFVAPTHDSNHGEVMRTPPAWDFQPPPPPLELRVADLVVGWIDGDVVKFRGFASERGAAHAAAVAHQAMLRRLARGSRAAASANESDLAAVRRASDRANAPANGRSVASVLRSVGDGIRGTGAGEYAFEIRVPPPNDELRMRGMAYVMYRALRSSGVAWPLLRPATAPERLTALATRTAANGASESIGKRVLRGLQGIRRFLDRASGAWTPPWTRPQRAG